MQYILTQQEYDKLVTRSDETAKQIISALTADKFKLQAELEELKDKYAKLLIFGVSANNESAKENLCKVNS